MICFSLGSRVRGNDGLIRGNDGGLAGMTLACSGMTGEDGEVRFDRLWDTESGHGVAW